MSENDEFDLKKTLEKAYDEIPTRENQKINKYTKIKTITGAEIIDLLLFRTKEETEAAETGDSNIYKNNDEPLLETISRWDVYLRECITGWVLIKDLTILSGDIDCGFDACIFPTKDLYYCIGEMGILDEMRKENLVVEGWLETLIQESSKPEPTQPEPGPKEKASVTNNQGGRPKNDPDGLVAAKIRELKNAGGLQHHMCNTPEVIRLLGVPCGYPPLKLKQMSDQEYKNLFKKPRSAINNISRTVFQEK